MVKRRSSVRCTVALRASAEALNVQPIDIARLSRESVTLWTSTRTLLDRLPWRPYVTGPSQGAQRYMDIGRIISGKGGIDELLRSQRADEKTAADAAVRDVRQLYLAAFQDWLAHLHDTDPTSLALVLVQ